MDNLFGFVWASSLTGCCRNKQTHPGLRDSPIVR